MPTKELLMKFIDRNILVFDKYAKYGTLSLRLLALMKLRCKQNNKTRIDKFYLPQELYDDIINRPEFSKHSHRILVYNNDLIKVFYNEKCSLAYNDAYLIIGLNKDLTNGILGSC